MDNYAVTKGLCELRDLLSIMHNKDSVSLTLDSTAANIMCTTLDEAIYQLRKADELINKIRRVLKE